VVARAAWQIERQLDGRLRGWPDKAHGPSVWLSSVRGTPQIVLAVDVPELGPAAEEALATRRAEARGATGPLRHLTLADPDLAPLLPLARMPLTERAEAVHTLGEAVESRSVRLTIDAKLQLAVAEAAKKAATKTRIGAAAVVVMDPATGEVLARAQWPDFDPGGTAWVPLRRADEKKFMGIYGPWSDKTGAHGVFQAGSVFKTLTAFLGVREGIVSAAFEPGVCPTTASPSFVCDQVDGGRPSFTLPGWSKPIHDHGDGGAHGTLDLVEGIARSSNVYFSQLALKLGPEPFRRLRTDGVEFGNPGVLDEKDGAYTGFGEAGSRRLAQTGFGQGAGSWSPMQAARFVSVLANGGTYIRCPSTMEQGAACESKALLPPGASVAPVLAGMEQAMKKGTGARLPAVPGVRIYGKTGTADAPGTRDEAPWGIKPGRDAGPHSWFVAVAEPSTNADCGAGAGRYVVAAVVPHGGFGASAAGPLVIDTIRALQAQGYLPPAPAVPAKK
jgi:cell division protein FtsI/penicillin-binding protein 2